MNENSDAEMRDIEADRLRRKLEKEMKSAKRLAIAAVVLNVIAFGLQIFRIIMRIMGVWE
jgi:type IV secretory pathway component VirB8